MGNYCARPRNEHKSPGLNKRDITCPLSLDFGLLVRQNKQITDESVPRCWYAFMHTIQLMYVHVAVHAHMQHFQPKLMRRQTDAGTTMAICAVLTYLQLDWNTSATGGSEAPGVRCRESHTPLRYNTSLHISSVKAAPTVHTWSMIETNSCQSDNRKSLDWWMSHWLYYNNL